MSAPVTHSSLKSAVLYKLFEQAQTQTHTLTKEAIRRKFGFEVGAHRVELAIEDLHRDGLVAYESLGMSITGKGYKLVESGLSRPEDFYSSYAELGDEWLENQRVGVGGIPAADRTVSRSDNGPIIEEILAGASELKELLRTENKAAAELGSERDVLTSEIDAAKELASHENFRLSRLLTLLVPGLRFLADKFASGAIGEAAKRLLNLLLSML